MTTQQGVEVIRFDALAAVPWANGGGTTRVVAVDPAREWAWRVSIADIDAPGGFSAYPGVDRVLVQLSDRRLLLEVGGVVAPLDRLGLLSFDGGLPASCDIPDGPTRDLNVMTRRGLGSAAVSVVTDQVVTLGPARTIAVVVEGSFSCDGLRVGELDAVRCEAGVTAELAGGLTGGLTCGGTVVVVELS